MFTDFLHMFTAVYDIPSKIPCSYPGEHHAFDILGNKPIETIPCLQASSALVKHIDRFMAEYVDTGRFLEERLGGLVVEFGATFVGLATISKSAVFISTCLGIEM